MTLNTAIICLIAIVSFLGVWASVCKIISLAGWKQLAKRHTAFSKAEGDRYSGQYLRLGILGNYAGCVNFHVSKKGLHISLMPIFSIGHPPLFFPWSAVRLLKQRQGFLGNRYLYDLGTPRVRRIAVHAEVHQAIQHHQKGAGI